MDNGLAIKFVQVRHDPLLEFRFRSHSGAAQNGARHLGEEALDQIEPGAIFGVKTKLKRPSG